jgi:hypothetical protein
LASDPNVTVTLGRSVEAVHRADKFGHERRGRAFIQRRRGIALLELTRAYDADPVSDRECFLLIMGHEGGGDAEFKLDTADLFAQLLAHLGIERGQRFVE